MMTMTAPTIYTRPSDPDLEEEDGKHAHIVRVDPGETATAKVLEARVMGTPIEALCGYVFVPQKDARALPVCSKCKEIYELHRMMDGGLPENPND